MEVHITPLVIDWVVSPKNKCRKVGPFPINLGVRGSGELIISMADGKGLALINLAKIENDQVN